MNYNQIAILLLQGTLVAFVILLLFRLRKRLGIGVLFACLGLLQFIQVFLSSTVFVSITDSLLISPGFSIFFTATLFILLIIYIKEDASETRKIIYALIIVNIVTAILLQTFELYFKEASINISSNLFKNSAKVLIVGTIALFLDSLLIIVLFEFISRHIRFLFFRILITMLIVVSFDTLFFSFITFWRFDSLYSILISGLISKGFFTVFYSIIFYIYLKYFDSMNSESPIFKVKDVFQSLSFKQKFESVSDEIKKVEEMYRLLADHSNDLICLHEPDSTFKYISPSVKNILGYEQSEFLGKQVFDILHNDDIEPLQDAIEQKVYSSGVVVDVIPCRVRHKDGRFIWLEFLISPVYNQHDISYFVSSGRDITERVVAEEGIKTSLKLLEKSEYSKNEASKIAEIGYWDYDSITDILTWSDYVYRIYGLDPKDEPLSREEMLVFFDEESQEKLLKATSNLDSAGTSYDIELKLINRKKEEIWVRTIVQPIYNLQNEMVGRRGVFQNITASKKAQFEIEYSKKEIQTSLDLLEESEYSLKEAQKLAKIGSWLFNPLNEESIWSEEVFHIWGLDPKKGNPKFETILNRIDPEDLDLHNSSVKKAIGLGIPFDIEFRICLSNNQQKTLRGICQPKYGENGEVVHLKGINQDITTSKKVQHELELSKQKVQSSLELLEKSEYSKNEASKIAKIGYWEFDSILDVITWSDYVYHIFGFDPKQPLPSRKEILKLYDKESLDNISKATIELLSKGTPYDLELKIINLNQETVWVRNVVQPIYNQKNEIIGRRGVLQNITAFKNVQYDLELSNQKTLTSLDLLEKKDYSLKQTSKVAKIGFWEYDIATDTSTGSEYVYQLFGVDLNEKIPPRKDLLKILDKNSQEKLAEATLELNLTGIPFDVELRLINLKNQEIWVRNVVQPIYNEQNELIGRRGILQNITASKKVQHDLELSKQKVQSSLELLEKSEYSKNEASKVAKIGYWEYDITTDIFSWSDYVYHIFGLDPKDKIPSRKEMVMFYDKESQEKLAKATLGLNLTGIPYDLEFRLINLKNEEVWVRNVVQPIYNQQNEVVGKRGVIQNITTSKKVQLELELSKQTIQTSFKLLEKSEYSKNEASKIAKIGYWEYDNTTDTFTSSDSVYYIFGIDPTDTIPPREEIVSCYDKESQEKLAKAILELNLNGTPFDLEFRLINLKNEEVWVRNVVQPLYNQQNKIIGRRGVTQNITTSKKAQLELELSKQKIQATLKVVKENEYSLKEAGRMARIGYWRYDKQIDSISWSKAIHKIYGSDPNGEVLKIETILSVFNEESRIKLIDATVILAKDGIPFDIELQMINLKNEKRWIRNIGEPIYNNKNEIVGRRGISQDITEQKLKQSELDLKSEKLYELNNALNAAQEMAHVGSWFHDLSSKKSEWSDETFRIWGFDCKKTIPDEEVFLSRIHKDDRELFNAATDLVFSQGASYDIEYRICLDNDVEKTVRSICKPIFDDDGKLVSLNGVNQDITAEKRRQKELDQKNDKLYELNNALHEAQELAHVGSWFYDYSSEESEWSDETFRIWDFDVKDPEPNEDTIRSRIHKDDLELFNRAGDLVYREGIPFDIEFRICLDNDEEKTVRSICKPIFGDDGVVVSLKGTNQDITAQKQARDKIEKAEEMYRVLTDYSNDLICLHDLDSSFKYISPSIKSLLGYEQSELLGKKVFGIVHKDDIGHLIGVMKERVSNSMFTDAFSCRVLHKDGHFIWLEFLSSPVYKNKKISHFVSSARNITQKVIAAQKIKSSLELIEKKEYDLLEVGTIAKIGYWEYDSLTETIIWSEYLYHIFGFDTKDEVPTRKEIVAFFDKESQKKIKQATLELISNGLPYDIELKLVNQKKEEVWVRSVVQPIYNKEHIIVGRRGLFQNITASKNSKIALEYSRQEVQSSFELLEKSEYSKNEASKVARIGYWEHDLLNGTVNWSDFVHEIFGSNPKDGIPPQNVIVDLLDKKSQELFTEVTLALISQGIPYDIELNVINLKKEKVWIRNVAQPIYNQQNEIIGKRGVMQDITDRKKIEAEHLRIKNDYERLFNNATVSIWNEDFTLVFKQIDELKKRNIPNIKLYLKKHPEVLFSLLEKLKVNNVNKATLKLFKATDYNEFLENVSDTFGEGADEVFASLMEAIWNNDKAFTSEINYKTLEGDEFSALLSVSIPQTEIEQKTVPASIQSIQNLKDAELEKRESEKKLNIAEKLAGIGSWIFDITTEKNEWSEEMFNIWNFDEKKGAPDYDTIIKRIHRDDLKLFIGVLDEVITNGTPYDIEFRIYIPNNEIKWIRTICKPIFSDKDVVVSLTGSNQDVTSQKQAIDDIEQAEEMYRILTDNSNDLICLQEPDSTFKYISPSIINILGYEQSEYLGKQVFNIVHKDDIQRLKAAMGQKVFQGKTIDAFSFRVRHKEGHFVWLEFLSSPVYKENEISYFVTSARDITQWVFAQQEIEEYQTSLQKMTTEMTFIEEKQKKQIASNIHDHLSQSLVISKMRINKLKKNTNLKAIDEDLKFIETHISEALENSRKITYELSPPVLYQLGFIDALNWLFENVEATHKITCSVHSNVSSVELSDLKSILLYRSIQELMKNAVKYANASLIRLDFDRNKLGINILLTDNGNGFDASVLGNYKNHSGSGFGLFAVQERIRNIQGKFEITSEINIGTSVKIFIPLAI